ncbi:biotin/lipoyl-binding protein [bacterium]|nr:biotin/lipoyl-binding protein [bacterium]MCB2179092.1 biotin/lipoyl-binding protein [bacterium]
MRTPQKKFNITVDGVTYAIEILNEANGQIEMLVDGHTHTVQVADLMEANRPANKPASVPNRPTHQQPAPVGGALTAPMPGDILEVLAAPGDRVQAGDALCVLEAMKMKNMLHAAQAGVVAEVRVQPGQVVKFGDVLITFEDPK